jgi:UPF0755 protein
MRALKILLVLAVASAIVVCVAGYVVYLRVHEPFRGSGAAEFVDVPSGIGPSTIGRLLIDAGIVRDALTFRAAVWRTGRARDLQAGEYRFDAAMTPMEVVETLARGDVYRRPLTFREGLTIAEMARVYEEAGAGRAADFDAAARDAALIRELDAAATDLEGYLFPETYSLGRQTPAPVLVSQMVSLFRKAFDASMQAAAANLGLTLREAVTLASLVEKETAVPEERPLVAAVYLNRRRIGMPMQADPTVIYALQRAGRYGGNLRRDDLQFDSTYNTYRYPHLPPGPIAAPGRAALEAAVRPAPVDYLYFVSRNDGSHAFARTLGEHNRNVQRWQVQFFRGRSNSSR